MVKQSRGREVNVYRGIANHPSSWMRCCTLDSLGTSCPVPLPPSPAAPDR